MRIKQTMLALALVGQFSLAVAAGPGYLGDLTNNTVGITDSFSSPGSFSDVYTFDLSGQSYINGGVVSINLSSGYTSFGLSNVVITLTDSTGTFVYDTDSQTNGEIHDVNGDALGLSSFLPPGMGYRFVVSGDVTGASGGSYGGLLQAAPVPEADTYAMLMAGLGLIGLAARCRLSTAV